MKRILCIILSVFTFVSALSFTTFLTFAESEKTINLTSVGAAIEAEEADKDDSFAVINDNDASGGSYILSQSNNKYVNMSRYDLDEYFKTNKIPITFTINAQDEGYYVIYMRVLTAKGKGDYYQRLNKEGYFRFTVTDRDLFDDNDKFTWITLSSYRFKKGINTVEFCYRQDMAIDKFVISKNAVDLPTGFGTNTDSFHFKETTEDTSHLYAVPEIKPSESRPRLLVRSDNIEKVKSNLTHSRNAGVYNKLTTSANQNYDCSLDLTSPGADNTNLNYLNYIESNAFLYLINNNSENGYKAINGLLNYLSTYDTEAGSTTASRKVGYMSYIAALVYDWCNDLLTTSQKEAIINSVIFNYKRTEMGWPPSLNAGFSHGEETTLPYMISFGIAVYGDYSEIYNIALGKALAESIPTRNMRYSESNYNQEGEFYSSIRSGSDWFLYLMLYELGCEKLITDNIRWQPYTYVFRNAPSGAYLRDGDGEAYPLVKSSGGGIGTFLAASLFDDPYMNGEFYRFYDSGNFSTGDPAVNMTMFLALNNVELPIKQRYELPLSYYTGNGTGMMTARTSWDEGVNANSMVVSFKTPERYFGGHSHRDSGHFYVYYKGPLALDTGVYTGKPFYDENGNYITNIGSGSTHNAAYAKQTIAHNAMLIYDPSEDTGDIPNNGGQYPENPLSVNPSDFDIASQGYGEVLGADFGPDLNKPEYTYLKGDITNAYNGKAEEYTRSFMFLNFFDDVYPGALIVFDKVKSKDASFKKTWLLHTQEEPEISGNTASAANTSSGYNGRMVNETLLPSADDLSISKIGGEGNEYPDISGVNQKAVPLNEFADESGKWRIEVSPKTEKQEDMFLNVITVSENDKEIATLDSEYIENDDFVGVRLRNKMVFFGKEKERYDKKLSVSVSGELSEYDLYIADLKEGDWKISHNGAFIETKSATSEGGVVTFSGAPGVYTLEYVTDSEIKYTDFDFLNNTAAVENKTLISYNNVFDSSIRTAKIDGVPYLSIKDIIKRMDENAVISETSDEITAEFFKGTSYYRRVKWQKGKSKATLTNLGLGNMTSSTKSFEKAVIEADNGELYVSYDSVINVLFAGYATYDEVADTVRIVAGIGNVTFDGSLKVNSDKYGTVYPDGETLFRKNKDNLSVYIKPDEGFSLKSVKLNGEEKLSSPTNTSFALKLGILSEDATVDVVMEPELSIELLNKFYDGRMNNVDNKFYSIFFGIVEGNGILHSTEFGIEINGVDYPLDSPNNPKVYSEKKYGVGISQSSDDLYYAVRGYVYLGKYKIYGKYLYFTNNNANAADILKKHYGTEAYPGFELFDIK